MWEKKTHRIKLIKLYALLLYTNTSIKICAQVREELKAEIRYQREVSGRVQKHPDVTTKHGKLKSKRKNQPTTIYVDDLAALDSLSEVCIIFVRLLLFIYLFFSVSTGENSQSAEKKIPDEFDLHVYWRHSVGHKSIYVAFVVHISGKSQ